MSTPTNSATDAVVEEVARVRSAQAEGGPFFITHHEMDEARQLIAAFLRAARQQGYVMVPVEPTTTMLEATPKPKMSPMWWRNALQAAPRCPWESDG